MLAPRRASLTTPSEVEAWQDNSDDTFQIKGLSPCFLCLFYWNVMFLVPTVGCLLNPHSLLSLSQYNPNLFMPPTSSVRTSDSGPIPEAGCGSSHLSQSHFLTSDWLGHGHVTQFWSMTHEKSPGREGPFPDLKDCCEDVMHGSDIVILRPRRKPA